VWLYTYLGRCVHNGCVGCRQTRPVRVRNAHTDAYSWTREEEDEEERRETKKKNDVYLRSIGLSLRTMKIGSRSNRGRHFGTNQKY